MDMKLTVTKDAFLSNSSNKQHFIQILGEKLVEQGCKVLHDHSDADLQIVNTAIKSAISRDTISVGNDTDLLVLLIHRAPLTQHDIFFTSEQKKNSKNHVWNFKEVKTGLGTFAYKHCSFFMLFLAETPLLACMALAKEQF